MATACRLNSSSYLRRRGVWWSGFCFAFDDPFFIVVRRIFSATLLSVKCRTSQSTLSSVLQNCRRHRDACLRNAFVCCEEGMSVNESGLEPFLQNGFLHRNMLK